MKKPNPIDYIIPSNDSIDHEEYEREKDKYINYLEHQNKELVEELQEFVLNKNPINDKVQDQEFDLGYNQALENLNEILLKTSKK